MASKAKVWKETVEKERLQFSWVLVKLVTR
jgi:hypothetical protein